MGFVRGVLGCFALYALAGCGIDAAGDAIGDAQSSPEVTSSRGDGGKPDAHDARPHDSSMSDAPHDARPGDAPRDRASPDAPDVNEAKDVMSEPPPSDCTTPNCMDPACTAQGYACVNVPLGWTLAEIDFNGDNSGTPCPTGYGPDTSELESSFGPATCGCQCTPQAVPNCVTGTLTGTTGGGSCSGPLSVSTNSGSCEAPPGGDNAFNEVDTSSIPGPIGAATCTGSVSTNKMSPNETPVSVCPAESPPPLGCGGGAVCVQSSSTRHQCVTEGVAATSCPPGFPSAHLLASASLGYTDSRSCAGACTCPNATGECVNPSVTLFTDDGCHDNGTNLPLDGMCHGNHTTFAGGFNSFLYSATPGVNCGTPAGSATAIGTVTPIEPMTACCTN
jgi:hypothetical protein